MRTFLTAITMALFFSTSALASSAYMPHVAPVTNQDCYQGPGIGLTMETGTGVWVCGADENNNKRPRPVEETETEEITETTSANVAD